MRSRLKAHDISIDNAELAHARLLPDVAERLRDLLNTWNVFIFRDPNGRKLDEIRPGPQEVELAKQVLAAFGPIVEALKHSEGIATQEAIDVIVEQTREAKRETIGIDDLQAVELAKNTSSNFMAALFGRAYKAVRSLLGVPGYASKVILEGALRKEGADLLDAYKEPTLNLIVSLPDNFRQVAESLWHNPANNQLIDLMNNIINFLR